MTWLFQKNEKNCLKVIHIGYSKNKKNCLKVLHDMAIPKTKKSP